MNAPHKEILFLIAAGRQTSREITVGYWRSRGMKPEEAKHSNPTYKSRLETINLKLDRLVNSGFINIAGSGIRGTPVYELTKKALDEIGVKPLTQKLIISYGI